MCEKKHIYKRISSPSRSVFRDRNSKFLAFAYYVETEEDVSDCLQALKKEYHDARHFCYAYILGFDNWKWRANDDGEPAGSAGLPIYNQCLSMGLTNIFVVVVRYFGGTKLGVPGLINAYKTATKMALEEAQIVEFTPLNKVFLSFPYEQTNAVMSFAKSNNFEVIDKYFENTCNITLHIPEHKTQESIVHFTQLGIEAFVKEKS
jgi:uncharacterized YigZ family protein